MQFKGLPRLPWRRDFFPTSLILGVLVTFALLAVRVVAIDSPVMGSDEYAYFQTAHFDAARDTLFRLDANMQKVDNKVYPWLYKLWSMASTQRIADVGRLFNAFLYASCALLLFAIFQKLFDRRIALMAALLYLVFPFSIYATMLLPEVEFQCFVYALVAIWVLGDSLPSWQRILIAAAVSALGYLIKPHAVAAILASAVWLGLTGLLLPSDTSRARRFLAGIWRAALYAIATYVSIKVLGRLLDPLSTGSVVSSFYAPYLQGLTSPRYVLAHLATIAMYAAGHLWVFCVLFIPALPVFAFDSWAWLRGRDTPERSNGNTFSRKAMATFVLLLVLSMTAMVAVFTDAAAAGSAFEKGRLHGRYLAALLPFLVAYALAGVYRTRAIVLAVLGTLALWSFALIGIKVFQLYPWDYPDMFAFFSHQPNGWSFDGSFPRISKAVLVVGTVAWITFALGRRRRAAYGAFLLSIMLLSHLQAGAWLVSQSRSSQASIDAGKAVATYLGSQPAGRGLIATTDRFGQASYFLAAIDSLQYVRWLGPGESLQASTLPSGVQWVVAGPAVQTDLPAAAELHFGPYRLFLLGSGVEWPKMPTPKSWDGLPVLVSLADAGGLTVFNGFNTPEPWGRWSAAPDASIGLPVRIRGPVIVNFFAWSSNPQGDDVTFELGDSKGTVHVAGTGNNYTITLMPGEEADRLLVRCHHIDSDGPRHLGVALARVQFQRP